MTITGIVNYIGEPRTFEVPTVSGGKKTMTAREIHIKSGNNLFVADAYDSVAEDCEGATYMNEAVIAELRFDERSIKTKDGNSFSQQQVTLVAIDWAFHTDKSQECF